MAGEAVAGRLVAFAGWIGGAWFWPGPAASPYYSYNPAGGDRRGGLGWMLLRAWEIKMFQGCDREAGRLKVLA